MSALSTLALQHAACVAAGEDARSQVLHIVWYFAFREGNAVTETFVANVDEVTVKRRFGQFITPTKGMNPQVSSVIERFAYLHGLASRECLFANAVQALAARHVL